MFEVAITKKPANKAGKTSLLWQMSAFAPTSNDLNVIVCDSKAVKRSYCNLMVHPRPQTKIQEIRVHIPCHWYVTEADWLIPGHSIRENQWNCVLQIRGALTQRRMQQSCSSQLRWWFLETITVIIIFWKHTWWLTVYREMG